MKKKNYIREGGICQFWDQWSKGRGYIDYQELAMAMLNGGKREDEPVPDSQLVNRLFSNPEEQSNIKSIEDISFNRDYKEYGKED